jgi:ketosteroid isomerase-like protein
MSQENVEQAYRVFDAFNRRDIDAFLALIDPHAEFTPRLGQVAGRSYHGLEGAREWWRDTFATIPDFRIEILDVRDHGAFIFGCFRARGHGLDSGAPFDQTLWAAGEWRRGKAVWWQIFGCEAEALEAVGLRE